jgi:hypothetical protein
VAELFLVEGCRASGCPRKTGWGSLAFKDVQLFRIPHNEFALVGEGFPGLSHVEELIPLLFGLRFTREGDALLGMLPVFVCFFHVIIFNTLKCPLSLNALHCQ